MSIEIVGWVASAVLVATLFWQVYSQYTAESVEGVSPGLFIGQLAASAGFLIYSYVIGDMVFLVAQIALVIAASLGLFIWWRRKDE